MNHTLWTSAVLFVSLIFASATAEDVASYVGDTSCVACHSKEVHDWKGSNHDEAMMVADENAVKGDFNHTKFTHNGITSTFYKKEGRFMVQTDGPDGNLTDYPIDYTFGVYPLQQYMVKFSQGRIQVLDIAWDSRSKEQGGQRWYHLHPDENITAGDILHWTGPNLNWNYMCADCHSTNLKKGYDLATKRYHTTWDVINVSCEACHGPASKHIEWSKSSDKNITNSGFLVSLLHHGRKWLINEKTLKPELHDANQSSRHPQIEVCAKCHSRRSQIDDTFKSGDAYHDHYLPSVLEENLYFPDGKIEDEVYVYNSFKESKMYEKGVTCTDCHDAHTLERKAEGDNICFRCHKMDTYRSPVHHHHKGGSTGASCVSCHMPARTYMGVDSRNDHSFRLPRPDLSVEMKEIPNACNLCHTDKDALWTTNAMKSWYDGNIPVGKQNFAHELQRLRQNSEGAPKALYDVLMSDAPTIAKATVVGYLGNYPSRQTYTTTLQMLKNNDPDIRRNALESLELFPPQMRIKQTFEMLSDPIKIVRIEAARQLAAFAQGEINQSEKALLEKVLGEYKASLIFNADRPESQLSLAMLYANMQMTQEAQEAFKEALRLQPMFVPAYVNYSDFLQKQGKESESVAMLLQGLSQVPDAAVLHYALGLSHVRAKETAKAIKELERAVKLEPNHARYSYVYAVSIGENDPVGAIGILEKSYLEHSGDLQIVSALAYYYEKSGNKEKSEVYKQKAQALQNFSVR